MTPRAPAARATSFAAAGDGIEAEDALLRAARAGRHGVLVWSAERPGLVAPAAWARRAGFAQAAADSAARGWPVHLRPTGGGLTPQGPGIATLALAGPAEALTTETAYGRLCGVVARALAGIGIATEPGPLPGSFCDGRWNLLCGGRKIAGTAQRWGRSLHPGGSWAILAHAVILDDLALAPPLDAVDALCRGLDLPVTAGPSAHTTVAAERAAGAAMSLAQALTAQARGGLAA